MNYYKYGGSLRPNHPTYVTREADQKLLNYLQQGEYCFVLNSRQIGKSSLRVRTTRQLRAEGILCANVDLSFITTDASNDNSEQWYYNFAYSVLESLDLNLQDKFSHWLQQQSVSQAVLVERLFRWILNQLKPQQKLVIFIDEIDSLINVPFKDNFFALIRSCYDRRAEYPELERLCCCLLGVASANDLITDKTHTSFNIGHNIELTGLTLNEAKSALLPGLSFKFKNAESLLAEILIQTGGQPFLTQKLCSLVAEYADADQPDLTSIIQNYILDNWEVQDNPQHLKTIRDRLVREPDSERLLNCLGLYQQLLQEKALKFDNSDEQFQLLLTGLVTKKENQLVIYNPIYQKIFDQNWLAYYLENLYPLYYHNTKKAWLSSEKSPQYLLEGESLVNAQAWAANKQLNALDYQLLAASQKEQDKRANQILQEANQQATQFLIQAKQKANTIVKKTFAITVIILIGASAYAYDKIERANQIANLEKKSNIIQKNFSTNQLDSLLEAIAAGQNLKKMVSQSQSISDYPSISPVTTLLSILRKIEVKQEINLEQYSGNDSFNRLSQNGDLIISIAPPNQIQLWNSRGEHINTVQVSTLSEKNIKIKNLEVSPDGQLIAVLMSDNTLLFFDQQGKSVNHLKYPKLQNLREKFTKQFIRFSPDSKSLAIALLDQEGKGQVLLWSMAENKAKMLTSKSIPSIQSLSFSPDHQSIAVGSEDGSIRIWQNTEIKPQIITAHNGYINSLAFNFESKILATGDQDGCLIFWQKQGIKWQKFLTQKCDSPITNLKFSPINQTLAILRRDGQLSQLREDTSGKKFAQLISLSTERQDSYSQLFFSPDGQYFQSFQGGLMRVWKLSKPAEISRLIFPQNSSNMLTAIADNPHAGVTVLGDRNGNFYVLNNKGEITQDIPGKIQSEIKGIFWSFDFQYLWTVTATGLIEKWSYQNQTLTRIKELEYREQIAEVKFDSETENLFLIEDLPEKNKLIYFNIEQQNTTFIQDIQTIVIAKDKQIKKIAIQPHSPFIAIVDQHNNLQLWNRQTQNSDNQNKRNLNMLNLHVTHLDFSQDGKLYFKRS